MLGNIRHREKNVKTCTDYNGDIENEPEEGEIVDNYELISSDEEFVMRQRIEELEAKNKEIEKIAVISRSYPSEYHYAKIQSCSYNQLNKDYWRKSKHDIAARVPKDVSSISSIEYEVSRRSSKRRRSRDGKRKPNHHNHCRNHSKRRKRRCRHTCSNESGRHKHRREFNYSMEAIDLHTESSNSLHSVTYVNEGTIDGPNQIDRDSLRFAVARSIHNSQLKEDTMGSLSKRLLEQPKKGNSDDEDIIIVENDDDPQIQTIEEDSSDSLEEKELRLIALKSAVLKKHMERKKRNAELAYSPTDFDDMLKFGVLENDIKSDIEVDLEGEDSQTPELISSPLASPKLLLSPQYIDDGEDSQQQTVDTKPVDMDIASSDSEQVEVFNEFHPVVQQQEQQPSSLSTLPLSSNELPFGIQHQDYAFSLYVSGLKVEPLPPGVEYYEEIAPPPPPFHQENLGVQEMEVENQENPEDDSSTKTNKNPTIIEQTTVEVKELSSCEDEEELALRALLLAKFQSPRNKKRKLDAESKDTANVNSKNETNEILKTNISSEWILKEAVRRFKLNKHLSKDTVDSKNSPFKENSVIAQHSPELVQMQYKEAEEEEKKVIVESFSFSDDVANSKLTENEIPQKWTLPKHSTSREMQSFSKSGDNGERKETCKASDTVERASPFKSLQTIHPPIDEVMDLVRNKYFTGNVSKPYSEECTRCEETGRTDSFTKLPQNAGDHLLNPLNENILETKNTNVNPIVTKSLEIHPVKANKETWEEKNCASNKSEESLNSTGIQEKNFDQITKTYLPVTRPCSEEKNSPISETHVPPSQEYPIESKSLEKPVVVDIPLNPSFGESEVNTDEFTRSVMNTNDPADREPKNKIFKQENFQEEDASVVKKDTLNSAITTTTSAFAKVSSKANQETKAVSKELKSNQASAKVIHKNLAKKYQNKLKVVNKITSTATALRKQQSNILPTYSVLKTTKIVKPNKVINKNVDMKPIQNNINLMEIKSEICTSPTASQVKKTRLITSKEQVKSMCQVPKLVINLQRSSSSTETSASEAENDIGDDYDYLCRPAEDYNDNASPISLIMESPRSRTPNRSNSPTGKCPEKNQQQFEEKLDSFLKSVRSKVQEQVISLQKTPQAERVMGNQATKANNNNTPVAVRHLPAAAQEEYRRLVHRMKLLEAQRKTLNTDTETSDLFTSKDDDLNIVPNSSASTATSASLGQNNLCKQVLIKNANSNTKTSPSDTEKPSRSTVLSSYENTFEKIGTGIITNLDKSLNLLKEAKNAKLSKLRLEKRLKVLKAEIDLVQSQHREEQHKISNIYPNICKTNDVIMALKQKRSKIFKLAVNLGKSLRGQDYRLNNDLKQNIIEKSKQLAEEIKLVNSLKLQNIEKFIEPTEGTKNNEDNKEEPSPATNNDDEQSLQVSTTTFQKGDNRELQDESLPQKNDNLQEEVEIFDHEEKKSLAANYYVSPLNNLNSGNSDLDPQGVLCPYDLMGHCEDKNCSYVHLTENFRKE
uniref:Zinc-finger domain-containing protein n=1 Tax=Glossina morsitans morsitans TaxID=37546 RepID=A0A1B0F9X2_GLOMM